jgi:hypothetical protein
MKHYYSTYIASNYYRNINSDDPEIYMHEDSALIAANSAEEAISKAKEWVLSKRRELMQVTVQFTIPRNELLDGWQERKKGWRWYEVNATGVRENGKLKVVYGYMFAPNIKYVKQKLKEMGTAKIIILSREDWNVFIR